jgi:hypothetical protein
MPHVDDGHIEAWLDRDRSGMPRAEIEEIERHLDSCSDCRDRMLRARTMRERAASILAGTGPTVVVPPRFEEVAARAAAGAPATRRPMTEDRKWRHRLYATAWAASMAAALGIGWLGRDLLREERIAFAPAASSESVTTASGAARLPAPDVRAAAEPAAPERSESDAISQESAGAATAGSAEPIRVAVAPPPGQVATPLNAVADAANLPASPVRPDTGDSTLALQERAAATIADAAAPRITDLPPPPLADRAARVPQAAAFAPAVAPPFVTDVWVPADRAEAERRLGVRLLTIPDLEVVAIELLRSAEIAVVRVRQTLADGTPVTLTQHRSPGLDIADAEPELTAVTVIHGDMFVTAAATLDVARVRELAQSVR